MAEIWPGTPANIAKAAAELKAGQLVAFPTETVYGLGANALDDDAVRAIYTAKGRPSFNPLIVHVPDLNAARTFARIDARAERLEAQFMPGPLTLVVPQKPASRISRFATADLPTVAIRVPRHPIARALISAAEVPVVAPSANRSGHVSATTAVHVAHDLGQALPVILDGGPCNIGLESTIIDLSQSDSWAILRDGAVSAEQIGAVIDGRVLQQPAAVAPQEIKAPGQLESHYAPAVPVYLNRHRAAPGEAYLGYGGHQDDTAEHWLNLSPTGDLNEAATQLFAMLRQLEDCPITAIAVAPIPNSGIGIAINDRLRRAAAPKSTQ